MQIKCVYYKDSGKFYTEGEADFDESIFQGCLYPKEVGIRLNELKLLPGLQSGTWDQPFTCYPLDLYPELIIQ